MGQETKAGRGGRDSNSRRGGEGCRGRDSTISGSVPSKASEVKACKDLEGDAFNIGSGNKSKDEDMLRTSMEMIWGHVAALMADYIERDLTNHGRHY